MNKSVRMQEKPQTYVRLENVLIAHCWSENFFNDVRALFADGFMTDRRYIIVESRHRRVWLVFWMSVLSLQNIFSMIWDVNLTLIYRKYQKFLEKNLASSSREFTELLQKVKRSFVTLILWKKGILLNMRCVTARKGLRINTTVRQIKHSVQKMLVIVDFWKNWSLLSVSDERWQWYMAFDWWWLTCNRSHLTRDK